MGFRHRLFTLSCGVLALAALSPRPGLASDGGGKGSSGSGAPATIHESIDRLFGQADSSRVPTGLLLEKGAIFAAPLIGVASDGAGALAPLSAQEFDQAYFELRRGSIDADLPRLETLSWRAQELRHRYGALPISFAAIRYTSIRDEVANYPVVDDVLQLPAGPLGDDHFFVTLRVWAPQLTAQEDRFVVPAELLALNGVDARTLSDLHLQVDDYPAQPIELDRPFELAHRSAISGKARLTLKARVDGAWIEGTSVLPVAAKPGGVQPPPPAPTAPATVPCRARFWSASDEAGTETLPVFDLTDPVLGAPFQAPWDEDLQTGDRGRLFLRVVPGDGRVGFDSLTNLCDVELENPVVVLDGFDLFNDRSFEDLQRDFGASLKKLQAFGFDLILVDYTNGRDWIERNGEALRSLMVNRIPQLVVQDALDDDRVAVVAGSMGTRVSQFGLARAEAFGEDHNTGLFIAVDGPFAGANIPIGFQAAAVDLANFVSQAEGFRASLESPAASQMLARTFPRGAGLDNPSWYLPRPEFTALNALMSGVLPDAPRNVAAASGSGTGSTQGGLSGRQRFLSFLIQDYFEVLFLSLDISVNVWSDGLASDPSNVYFRRFCLNFLGADCIFSSSASLNVFGGGFDLAPGSYRLTTKSFLDALGQIDQGTASSSFTIDRHNFVPPSSAVGAGEPWDSFVSEKCNFLHGPPTPSGLSLAMRELLAFREGTPPPPQPPLYTTACSIPEPAEYCYPGVFWYQNPSEPEFIDPWADPVNCYVHPIPGGQPAIDTDDFFATEPSSLFCPDGSSPGPNGCAYFEVTDPYEGLQINGDQLLIWAFSSSLNSCPVGTDFLGVQELGLENLTLLTCSLPPLTPTGTGGYEAVGPVIFGPPQFSCSSGLESVVDGGPACLYGVPPEGTASFDYAGSFYYNGAD